MDLCIKSRSRNREEGTICTVHSHVDKQDSSSLNTHSFYAFREVHKNLEDEKVNHQDEEDGDSVTSQSSERMTC